MLLYDMTAHCFVGLMYKVYVNLLIIFPPHFGEALCLVNNFVHIGFLHCLKLYSNDRRLRNNRIAAFFSKHFKEIKERTSVFRSRN